MKRLIIFLAASFALNNSFAQTTTPSTQTTIPASQPLPAVPPAPATPVISPAAPQQPVPVQSITGTDPNDLNKSNTANPDLLKPPMDSTSTPIINDSTPRKPKK